MGLYSEGLIFGGGVIFGILRYVGKSCEMTTWNNMGVKNIGRWTTSLQAGMGVIRGMIWQWKFNMKILKMKHKQRIVGWLADAWWFQARVWRSAWQWCVPEKCLDWTILENSLSKQNRFCFSAIPRTETNNQCAKYKPLIMKRPASWHQENSINGRKIVWIIEREGNEGKSYIRSLYWRHRVPRFDITKDVNYYISLISLIRQPTFCISCVDVHSRQ